MVPPRHEQNKTMRQAFHWIAGQVKPEMATQPRSAGSRLDAPESFSRAQATAES